MSGVFSHPVIFSISHFILFYIHWIESENVVSSSRNRPSSLVNVVQVFRCSILHRSAKLQVVGHRLDRFSHLRCAVSVDVGSSDQECVAFCAVESNSFNLILHSVVVWLMHLVAFLGCSELKESGRELARVFGVEPWFFCDFLVGFCWHVVFYPRGDDDLLNLSVI